jgi:hypothetical protein
MVCGLLGSALVLQPREAGGPWMVQVAETEVVFTMSAFPVAENDG